MKLNKKTASQQQGFSIIELVVVLGLVAIMAFFLAYIGIYHFQTYNSETTDLTIAGNARSALDDIDNYVRQANQVLTSYSTYTTGQAALVLQLTSIDLSGQQIAGTYDTVVFYLSGTDLQRKVFPDAASSRIAGTKTLANNVVSNSFSFTYDNANYLLVKQVTCDITISQVAGTQTRSITLSSQSTLRNH